MGKIKGVSSGMRCPLLTRTPSYACAVSFTASSASPSLRPQAAKPRSLSIHVLQRPSH